MADEDGVIAAIVARHGFGERCARRRWQAAAPAAAVELDREPHVRLAGKVLARSHLVIRQDVDAEMRRRVHHFVHVRALGDGDDAKRRLKRPRHEGVRGHASHLAVVLGGDHRHARCKAAHDLAEEPGRFRGAADRSCRDHSVELRSWSEGLSPERARFYGSFRSSKRYFAVKMVDQIGWNRRRSVPARQTDRLAFPVAGVREGNAGRWRGRRCRTGRIVSAMRWRWLGESAEVARVHHLVVVDIVAFPLHLHHDVAAHRPRRG